MRYQVKFRRRRDGATDYRQRKRLIMQDKNKYQTPRHRLVVRITNRTIICQIVRAELEKDTVIASAYSSELKRYGLPTGLKNYSAAYCTGLLVARRVLKVFGLDEKYKGNAADGVIKTKDVESDSGRVRSFWVASVDEERHPFRCVLDIGVRATTKGARLFGALKGASDGGLDIPHSEGKFPGFNTETKEYDPKVHKDRIFGGHIASYMKILKEEGDEAYQRQFSSYVKAGIVGSKLEALFTKVHKAIRDKPERPAKAVKPHDLSHKHPARLTLVQRKSAVAIKKKARVEELSRLAKAAAAKADS